MSTASLLSSIPLEIRANIISEFQQLHEHYFLGKWQNSELNGGRFGEAILRFLEYRCTGAFTPIGTQLDRSSITSLVRRTRTISDSLRLQVLTLTELIMDFRNRRDVAHLGTVIVNVMDATFVINAANWILAEILRIEGQTSPDEACNEIKKIVERKVPIVEEIDGRLKTLDPRLTIKEKILVCLYQKYPQKINDTDLILWLKDKNPTRFKKYIKELERHDLVDYTGGRAILTMRGNRWVEKNIQFELDIQTP